MSFQKKPNWQKLSNQVTLVALVAPFYQHDYPDRTYKRSSLLCLDVSDADCSQCYKTFSWSLIKMENNLEDVSLASLPEWSPSKSLVLTPKH